MERLKTLYRLGDIEEAEYVRERADMRGQIEALQPVLQPELEQAALALESIGELLQQATLEEMEQLFHSLLTTVYLDHSVEGYVVGIEPKPFLKELMDISTLPTWKRPTGDDDNPDGAGSGLSEAEEQGVDEPVAEDGKVDIMRRDAGNEKQVAEAQWTPVPETAILILPPGVKLSEFGAFSFPAPTDSAASTNCIHDDTSTGCDPR